MNLDLTGKIALVTGSTSGIGFATATKLAQLNAQVYVNGRTQPRVDEAVKRVKSLCPNANVHGFAGDLATEKDAQKLFETVPKLDILVNNLAIFEVKPFEEITDDEWRRYFEVNVLSGVRLSRFYFPKMKQANWGRIVFISSDSGLNITPEMIHYSMTKTAELAVARGLAELTKGTNVTVNSVIVGLTDTEGLRSFLEGFAVQTNTTAKDVEKGFAEASIAQRCLKPEEIANMIAYLCSPASSGTNGAMMRVDGGILKHI